MRVEEAVSRVCLEMYNAERKFPTFPVDPIHAAAVVEEEAGELVRAALQYTYEIGSVDEMMKEAVQIGAMALRFLVVLHLMKSRPSRQVETAPHTTQLAAVLHKDARGATVNRPSVAIVKALPVPRASRRGSRAA